VLKQDQNAAMAMEDQVMLLFVLQHSLFDYVVPRDVDMVAGRYMDAVKINRPEIVEQLVSGQKMTDEIEQGLKDELNKFKNSSV
jgi:F0F1-type ATP synthase alpha subunit